MQSISMNPVESSNIAALGHAGTTLRVQFHNGGVYDYANVSPTALSA